MSRRLVIEADGGSRGNPGPAGFGALVRDADSGELLAERAAGIGTATNNVAEYGGLIAGLTAALELSPDSVEVRMDSKLVVEQMSGRWKVKHPAMQPLASEARLLVRRLGPVRFTWIPRAQNAHADRLANEAMDAAAAGHLWRPAGDSGPGDVADAWLATTAPTPTAPTPTAPTPTAPTTTAPTTTAPTTTAPTTTAPSPAAPPTPAAPVWRPPSATPTTMLLLRHGQTALSVSKRFSGVGDPELTEVGHAQAAAAARRLATSGAVAVVSSPLRRARATAEAVARGLGHEVALEPDLRETDFGDWDGHTFAEVQERWPSEMAAWLADPSVAPPGGESFSDTAARVARARDRLVDDHDGERIIVVSHVTPIKTFVRMALDAPASALYRMQLDLACLSEIQWYSDGPAVLRSFNDIGHLTP